MTRFNPELSDTSRYPYSCTLAPRYGDLDPNNHINNVAFARLLEEGRIRFGALVGYSTGMLPAHPVLVFHAIHHVGQGHYPGEMTVSVGVSHIGRSSWQLSTVIYQGSRLCVVAEATSVMIDHQGVVALIPPVLARLQAYRLREV